MSLRHFKKIASYVAKEVLMKVHASFFKILPQKSRSLLQRRILSKSIIAITRHFVLRTFQRSNRNARLDYIRPFFSLHHQHRFHLFTQHNRSFLKVQEPSKSENFDRIRLIFGTNIRYNRSLTFSKMPENLNGYEIGNFIACGCNAAVYKLRLLDSSSQFPSCSKKRDFPLALKMMFNYQFEMPERHLWNVMGSEIIPLRKIPPAALQGRMANFKPLKRQHPNLIEMHTAFVDNMPILENANMLYPEALPNFENYTTLLHEPKTFFIVMKRYQMTLRDYVLAYKRNYWKGRVLYGQLLEALVYLFENKISHRDIKSDNVLLEFDHEDDTPILVLSDFGCALAVDNWIVPFENYNVDLGGNVFLRAPEIRRAHPGPGKTVDFSMADTWSVATLAYEIFTRSNPFFSCLSSENYKENELVKLPKEIHHAVKNIIYDSLKINSKERLKPHIAANVVLISLFRFGQNSLYNFFEKCGFKNSILNLHQLKSAFNIPTFFNQMEKTIDKIIELYAAETILSKFISPNVISHAELQLRATFLARLNRDEVHSAMIYILNDKELITDFSSGASDTHTKESIFSQDNCY